MALYNDLDALLAGSTPEWVTAVNELKGMNEDLIVRDMIFPRFKNVPAEKIIQYGQVIGSKCADSGLKYSQLRRFIDEIKAIETSPNRIEKLKLFRIPLLHGYSRQPDALKPFYKFVDELIKSGKIKDDEDFENFVRVIDSITAHYEALRNDKKD